MRSAKWFEKLENFAVPLLHARAHTGGEIGSPGINFEVRPPEMITGKGGPWAIQTVPPILVRIKIK
jgi:hypothetical protein